jgi:uncharacterized membrane protein
MTLFSWCTVLFNIPVVWKGSRAPTSRRSRGVFFACASTTWVRGNPVILIILWAIGLSMIALAALIHLPLRLLAGFSIATIALHKLLDPISPERFGRTAWLWDILHQQNLFSFMGMNFVTGYPVLPWIGVMSLGYCLGTIFLWDAARRHRFLLRLGLALTAAFIVLRAINVYGDPVRWSHQASAPFTTLSFLNTAKYPPSLDFLLMTLGPAITAMAWLERFQFSFTNPLIVFGRVPFFYYAAHLLVAHLIAVAMNFARYGRLPFLLIPPPSMGSLSELFPPNYGFPLWTVTPFGLSSSCCSIRRVCGSRASSSGATNGG